MSETERIRKVYERRDRCKGDRYSLFRPAALFASQQRERHILNILTTCGTSDMRNVQILDLGCGTGSVLRDFVRYGARPENCFGLDLLQDRIETAKCLSPNMSFVCANAETLPYKTGSFDLVLCFTVFTSILDPLMKRQLASEMLRVLRPDGYVLWYDFRVNNPRNPDVRGMPRREIEDLFSMCDIKLSLVTLAPPLARLIVSHFWVVGLILENLRVMNTHYIGIIKKRA